MIESILGIVLMFIACAVVLAYASGFFFILSFKVAGWIEDRFKKWRKP